MQAFNSETVTSHHLDHHGLMAAVCRDLKISQKINARIGSPDPRRVVQPGTAAVAMVLNGLGFSNHRLYLTPQFFESKALETLFEESLESKDFNDHTLGKALDEIADYGASKLFGELAFEIGEEHNLIGKRAHLDTTSFSLHGQYESDEAKRVDITHGYSKDHRPDLKQVLLSLTVTGPSDFPLWMEPLDGNSSDKTTFHETLGRIRSFQKQLASSQDFLWIADSAFYTAEKISKYKDFHWVSRVPETNKECLALVSSKEPLETWKALDDGYLMLEHASMYGKIPQRWLLIYSEQAYQREKKTFEKRLKTLDETLSKKCRSLSKEIFSCDKDAKKAIVLLKKKLRYHVLQASVEPVKKYASSGRPSAQSQKEIVGYRVLCQLAENQTAIEEALRRKGRFVIATNNLEQEDLPSEKILSEYKAQQGVERGFRFLKDPWFMVDSFYLKKRSRIEALMMIMTLCLLVYNVAQHRLRTRLVESHQTVPNQKGKPIQNPTMRWVFQLFEGIGWIQFEDATNHRKNHFVTNLTETRRKIICLMGSTACSIYQVDSAFLDASLT